MEHNKSKISEEAEPSPLWITRGSFIYIRWTVTLIVGFGILRWVDFGEAVAAIVDADIRYLTLVVILAFFDRYLMAYKWAMLLRTRGVTISNTEAFRIYLASSVIAVVVPLGVSADIFKLGRITQAGAKLDKATASIIVERAIGCLAAVLLAGIGLSLLVLNHERQFLGLYYLTVGLFTTVVAGIVFLGLSRVQGWLSGLLLSFGRYRVAKLIVSFFQECIVFSRQKKLLSWFLVLSLFEQSVQIVMNFFGGKSVGLPINANYFFAIIPLSGLLLALPISVNFFGVTEGVYILLFSLAGLTATQSLSLGLAMRAVGLIVLIPASLVLLYDSMSFKTLRQSP